MGDWILLVVISCTNNQTSIHGVFKWDSFVWSINLFGRRSHKCVCACRAVYLVAVRRSGDACQSACCQTHPGDSENHMTRTGAGGFYRSVPDRRDDDTPTGTEKEIRHQTLWAEPLSHSQLVSFHFTRPQKELVCCFYSWRHSTYCKLSLLIVQNNATIQRRTSFRPQTNPETQMWMV